MKIIYYWSVHPTSTIETIMRETQVKSEHTIVDYYNFLRDVCQEWVEKHQAGHKMGGFSTIIEIDESKFYRAKYNRGRMLNRGHGWVFGLMERGTNNVRLFQVEKRNADTLLPIIANNVESGSTIISDGWLAYGNIAALNEFIYS